MKPDFHPQGPPPYVHAWFIETDRLILDMISFILGFKTSEFVDETILVMLSMFTPGQPPVVMYDYAKYIADRMHEQFLRMSNERVFKYSSVLYTLFLYYHAYRFPIALQRLDTRGNPRSVVF